jgi:hypothetical protein
MSAPPVVFKSLSFEAAPPPPAMDQSVRGRRIAAGVRRRTVGLGLLALVAAPVAISAFLP